MALVPRVFPTLEFILKRILPLALVGIVCLFATTAHAQFIDARLPDAPKPTLTEHFLYTGDAAARGFDVYTTKEMLKNPYCHEFILPNAIAHHSAALAVTDGAITYAVYRVSRALDEHHHHRLAILVPLLEIVGTCYIDIHDNYISGLKPNPHPIAIPNNTAPGLPPERAR